MGILATLFQAATGGRGPLDDYWYTPLGQQSATNIRIDADMAMKTSAVWACVGVISENLAAVPLLVYRRLADGGRQRATGYYLYDVLHDAPNRKQTPIEFREFLTASALLRGHGYAFIQEGRRGFAEQLIPLHPDAVTTETLSNGRDQYRVRQRDGTEIVYGEDEILHLQGPRGMSFIEYARDSIGLALATESYGARLFGQGARPGGVLTHPGKLSDTAKDKLRRSWQEAHGGLNKAHGTAVLEEGMTWQSISMNNEDAQFLATREFQIADIARWFRVPLHMIQETSKVTSWGTGIEQLSLAFVTYTLLPWAKRWEQVITRDLIVETSTYYAEHEFAALLRGDLKSRYEAYATARNWGWLNANDIRRLENMDPMEGGDVYLEPGNMRPAGTYTPPAPEPAPTPPPAAPPPDSARNSAHYWLLLREVAARIVRREVAAVSKVAKRCSDGQGWAAALDEFYAEHAGHVAETLQIGRGVAERYCGEQRAALLQGGAGVMQDWETTAVERLMNVVGGESWRQN